MKFCLVDIPFIAALIIYGFNFRLLAWCLLYVWQGESRKREMKNNHHQITDLQLDHPGGRNMTISIVIMQKERSSLMKL